MELLAASAAAIEEEEETSWEGSFASGDGTRADGMTVSEIARGALFKLPKLFTNEPLFTTEFAALLCKSPVHSIGGAE
jgi:hypothetical protein